MWRNPITEKQIRVLSEDWGIKEGTFADGQNRSITGWFQVITVGASSNYLTTFTNLDIAHQQVCPLCVCLVLNMAP